MKIDPNQLYSIDEIGELLFPEGAPRNLAHQLAKNGIVPLKLRRGSVMLNLYPGRSLLQPVLPVQSVHPEVEPPSSTASIIFPKA